MPRKGHKPITLAEVDTTVGIAQSFRESGQARCTPADLADAFDDPEVTPERAGRLMRRAGFTQRRSHGARFYQLTRIQKNFWSRLRG